MIQVNYEIDLARTADGRMLLWIPSESLKHEPREIHFSIKCKKGCNYCCSKYKAVPITEEEYDDLMLKGAQGLYYNDVDNCLSLKTEGGCEYLNDKGLCDIYDSCRPGECKRYVCYTEGRIKLPDVQKFYQYKEMFKDIKPQMIKYM